MSTVIIDSTPITKTTKGHRVWLQGLEAHNWNGGNTYIVSITPQAIIYTKSKVGKTRKVTASKGGIIDTTSQKVTQWAKGATHATVYISDDGEQISIMRVEA